MESFERFDLQIGLWLFLSVFFGLVSTSFCDNLSIHAQGAGVPEIKTVLSGIDFSESLSLKTLVARDFSLAFTQGAGYLIGLQGGVIHCSCIIADLLSRLRIFREFNSVVSAHDRTLSSEDSC